MLKNYWILLKNKDMKKKAYILVLYLAVFMVANATVVQKAVLKNGSVLYGYVKQQDGMGKLTFHTDSAIISIDSRCTEILEHSTKPNESEVKCDIVFVQDSVAVDYVGGPSFEAVLREKKRKVSNVVLLEKGAWIKYFEKSPNAYVITWKDIVSLQSDRRCKTALSGVDRICKMKNGQTYEGQYAGENEDLQELYLKNGVIQSFEINDVVKYNYRAINPNQDIFAQSELLDIIKTKTYGEIKGVITEQSYEGKTDADNYFIIKKESGDEQKVKLSDIQELSKEINAKYDPKFDVILKNGEMMINRQSVSAVNVTENNNSLILDSIGSVTINAGDGGKTMITVEYRSEDRNNVENYQIVKVSSKSDKKGTIYGFTYKDIVNATVSPSKVETSVNHTTKADYTISGNGWYALYKAKEKKAIPFKIGK